MAAGLELSESRARELLMEACAVAGYDPANARLLRIGSNAVFRLAVPVVVRISRPNTDIDQARRTVAVARWLESADYPAVRLASGEIDQPIVIDRHGITFWHAVSLDGDEYASVGEVAEVFAKLHSLTAPDSLLLPPLAPFQNASERIASNDWLNSEDRNFLTETLADLRSLYASLSFVLPPGVIHGDASVGNVLHDFRDKAVVIDLDGFAIGPREWDVALTAIYYDSFGWHTREEYETFVRVYGFDIMQWAGYPAMRAIREFLMVTWVIQKANESEWAAGEARKRIKALRTGASRKDWEPS
ncbi:MAG TPA: aminoglycoside phosphotransferase family protein [Streptosporangiaceae bacterium]|nr:aminoglycoside phosphotransferase family protein [Streptosporangiaceae bacterium]